MAKNKTQKHKPRKKTRVGDTIANKMGRFLFDNGDGDPDSFIASEDLPVVPRVNVGRKLRQVFAVPEAQPVNADLLSDDDYITDKDGNIHHVRPQVTSKWSANYFYSDRYRDNLAIWCFIVFPILYAFMISAIVMSPSARVVTGVALAFLIFIHINIGLRLYNRALFNVIVPDIPLVSPFFQEISYDIDIDRVKEFKEEWKRRRAEEKIMTKAESGVKLTDEEERIYQVRSNSHNMTELADELMTLNPDGGSFGEYVRDWMVDNSVVLDDVPALTDHRLSMQDMIDIIEDRQPVKPPTLLALSKMTGVPLAEWRSIYHNRA